MNPNGVRCRHRCCKRPLPGLDRPDAPEILCTHREFGVLRDQIWCICLGCREPWICDAGDPHARRSMADHDCAAGIEGVPSVADWWVLASEWDGPLPDNAKEGGATGVLYFPEIRMNTTRAGSAKYASRKRKCQQRRQEARTEIFPQHTHFKTRPLAWLLHPDWAARLNWMYIEPHIHQFVSEDGEEEDVWRDLVVSMHSPCVFLLQWQRVPECIRAPPHIWCIFAFCGTLMGRQNAMDRLARAYPTLFGGQDGVDGRFRWVEGWEIDEFALKWAQHQPRAAQCSLAKPGR